MQRRGFERGCFFLNLNRVFLRGLQATLRRLLNFSCKEHQFFHALSHGKPGPGRAWPHQLRGRRGLGRGGNGLAVQKGQGGRNKVSASPPPAARRPPAQLLT